MQIVTADWYRCWYVDMGFYFLWNISLTSVIKIPIVVHHLMLS